jgi:hypothetical protein
MDTIMFLKSIVLLYSYTRCILSHMGREKEGLVETKAEVSRRGKDPSRLKLDPMCFGAWGLGSRHGATIQSEITTKITLIKHRKEGQR